MKKEIPLLITFLTGVIIVVTFFIPHQPFGGMQQRLLIWYSIVLGFTLLLGVDNLLRGNIRRMARRQAGWGYAAVLMAGFVICFVAGVVSLARHNSLIALNGPFMYVYTYMIVPLQATMFARLRLPGLPGQDPGGHPAADHSGHRHAGAGAGGGRALGQASPDPGLAPSIAMSLRVILGLERTYLS